MSPFRSHLLRCLTLSLVVAFFAGCAQEEWRWDWWNKDTKKTQTKPSATSRRPAERGRTDQSKPASEAKTANAKPANPEDDQAIDVQKRVQKFTQDVEPRRTDPVAYNDFNSKIERQQDPERRHRISRGAHRAAEPEPTGHGVARVASDAPRGDELEISDGSETTHEPRPVNMNPLPIEPASTAQKKPVDSPALAAASPEDTKPAESTEPQAQMLTGDVAAADARPAESTKVVTNGRAAINEPAATPETRSTPVETETKPEPPKLTDVRVAAGPEVEPAESAAQRVDAPTTNAPQTRTVTIDTFKQKLEEQKKIVAKDPNDIAEQLRLRMMYLIDKQDDKAMALDEGMDVETHAIIQAQLRAMMASREADGRDPATYANNLLESVENLRTLVRAKADLSVPKVVLCKETSGFGVYEPFEQTQFPAGVRQEVLIYIEVDNFSTEITPRGFYRTLLTVRPSLLNKRTGEELWSIVIENIEDLSRRRREDFFVTVPQTIPASLAPGEYVLKVEIEDVLVGKINSGICEFTIVPAAGGRQ